MPPKLSQAEKEAVLKAKKNAELKAIKNKKNAENKIRENELAKRKERQKKKKSNDIKKIDNDIKTTIGYTDKLFLYTNNPTNMRPDYVYENLDVFKEITKTSIMSEFSKIRYFCYKYIEKSLEGISNKAKKECYDILNELLIDKSNNKDIKLLFFLKENIPLDKDYSICSNENNTITKGFGRAFNILNVDFDKKKNGNSNLGKNGLKEILKYLIISKNFKNLTRSLDEKYLKNFSLNIDEVGIGEVGIDDIRKLIKDLYDSKNFIERCMLLDTYLRSYNSTFYKFADGTLYSRINNKTKSSKSEAFTYIFYDLYKIGKKIDKIKLAKFKKELNKYKNKTLYGKYNSKTLLYNEKNKIKNNNKLKNNKIKEINKRINSIDNFNNFKKSMKIFKEEAKKLNKKTRNKSIKNFEELIKKNKKTYSKFYTPRIKYLKDLRNISEYIESNKTFKLNKGKNYTKEELKEKKRKIAQELTNLETKFQNGKVDKKKKNANYGLLYPRIEYLKDLYNLTNYIDKSNLYEGITNNKIKSLQEEYNTLSNQLETGKINKNSRPGSLYNKVKYLRHKIGKYHKNKVNNKFGNNTPKKKFHLTLNNNTNEWATMGEYSNEEYNNLKKREAALKKSKSPNSITNKLNLRNNNASLINQSYKNRVEK
jgi:hypothetical protein